MSITLQKLDYKDSESLKKIFEWRNDEVTRKFSNNTNIITPEIFQKILEKYKESNIDPLLIFLDNSAVGVLTFVNNNNNNNNNTNNNNNNHNKIYIGINIDPSYRNKNIGSLSLDYFKKNKQLFFGINTPTPNIHALVNKKNHASLKLFYKHFVYFYETENYIEFLLE